MTANPPPEPGPPSARRGGWDPASVAAAAWAAAFGLLHIAWAAGSRLAIRDPEAADAAFDLWWFRAYNLAVAVACAAVTVAVVLLVRTPSAAVRVWSRRLIWLASGVLIVRGGIGAAQLVTVALSAAEHLALSAWGIDLYMLVGGMLLAMVAWRARHPWP